MRAQPKPLTREQRRAYRAQLAKYEAKGSSYGQSVAGMMYVLAEGLGRADLDAVWYVFRYQHGQARTQERLTRPFSRRLCTTGSRSSG